MNSDDKLVQEQQKLIFSKKLNYYMALNHKQQDDIVNDLGINKSTISTWCRGTKMPRVNAIQLLADYFGVGISDLIEDEDNSKTTKNISLKKKTFINRIVDLDEPTLDRYIQVLDLIDKED